jgi:hypothetical protein
MFFFRHIRHRARLQLAGLLDSQPSGGRGALILQVLLGLLQFVLRGLQRDLVIAGLHRRDKCIAPQLQLGHFHLHLRRFHRIPGLFVGSLVLGLGLNDFLLRFGQVGFRFAQVVFLLRGVELDHHIAGFHQLAIVAQVGDVQAIAAHHRSDEHLRIAAL